jgi:Potential Queuosine, Q, salvage protein family
MPPERSETVCDEVREACAWVAARARSVHVEEAAIEAYAAALPAALQPFGPDPLLELTGRAREDRIAFVVCLNAINFGSGWWPTIRKRPGRSGFFTVAAGLAERFRGAGPWDARELAQIEAAEIGDVLGQDGAHPLMADFACSLRDLGERLGAQHGGSFEALVDAAGGSAPALAGLLAEWDSFADASTYGGFEVPFYKRAQLVPADLGRAGLADLRALDRLTAFADNLVPHVLRLDGILRLDPALAAAIDAEELLVHGSAEEVELRACAVHAIELISAATSPRLSAAEIDAALWNRGGAPRYKAVPRPRSRNTAY